MGLGLVVDVSVFIDALFVYDEERSERARSLFRMVSRKGYNIFEPAIFGVELASQLARRKPRRQAKRIYEEIVDKVIIVEEVEYDLLLDIAFSTGCRAVDSYYIAVASILSVPLVSADRVMVFNARRYGVDAYYTLDKDDYRKLMTRLGN